MKRFLKLASKALAVVGVLTLMYVASAMQQAKAQPQPPSCVPVWAVINGEPGWITCTGTTCPPEGPPRCCKTPRFLGGDDTDLANWSCCYGALILCPPGG